MRMATQSLDTSSLSESRSLSPPTDSMSAISSIDDVEGRVFPAQALPFEAARLGLMGFIIAPLEFVDVSLLQGASRHAFSGLQDSFGLASVAGLVLMIDLSRSPVDPFLDERVYDQSWMLSTTVGVKTGKRWASVLKT